MCGIVGWLGDRESILQFNLDRGVAALRHRGPDSQASVVVRGEQLACGLGHTRLAIIDLSPGGAQPMSSEDGRYTLVFNGELYNFQELRAELVAAGYLFRSHSDTEVLLNALIAWGPGACTRLRGMFAFALFDRRDQALLLARDRLGIKPLYVARNGGVVAFASEVRALIAAGVVKPRLDPEGVAGLLATGSVPEPGTILTGVEMLAPGTSLRAGRGSVEAKIYWRIPEDTGRSLSTAGEAMEALGTELRAAVGMHLVADVPLGVFVSGGIDSSVLLAMAAERASGPLTAITVALEDANLDETRYARTVADLYGARHLTIRLSAARAVAEIDDALAALDQPSSDGINTFFVSRATREAGIKVAISGLGGDELFAGYRHFRTFQHLMNWRSVLGVLSCNLPAARERAFSRTGRWEKGRALLESGGDARASYEALRAMFQPRQVAAIVPNSAARLAGSNCRLVVPGKAIVEADPVNAFSLFELTRYMRNTLLRDTDAVSMAVGLEVRVPLIDHKVVELAMAIPGWLKIAGHTNKQILAATVPSLPATTTRRAKQGFALPFGEWLRGPLKGWAEDRLLDGPIKQIGILDQSAVEAVWRGFLKGEEIVSHSRVWTLVALSDWCQRNGVRS